MRHVVGLAVVYVLLAACTAAPRDELAGTWQTHLSSLDACDVDLLELPANLAVPSGSSCTQIGTWQWVFTRMGDRPETDERSYDFQLWHEGTLEVYGQLVATATQITIDDEGGRMPCMPAGPKAVGRYEWNRHDDELRLILINDPCFAIRAPVARRPWAKVS